MDVVLIVVGVLLIIVMVVGIVVFVRTKAPVPPPPPGPSPWSDGDGSGTRIVLDVSVPEPDAPSVQRLVQEAASRALDASPELEVVEVVDRDGVRLGEIRRIPPVRREVDLPASLHEPHQPRSHSPDPMRGGGGQASRGPGGMPAVDLHAMEVETPGARPFADQYDLPAEVRAMITDADDPTAVIAALLSAAGRPVERRGDLVLSGEVAVVVALVDDGGERSLSRAFLKIRESGAPYGLIVRLGYADPVLVHKREIAAPQVRHVPARAVQRMADAVALGEDPLAFALGPPLAHR